MPEGSKQLVKDPDINLQLSFWGSREVLLTFFPLAAFLNKSLLSKAVSCRKISIWSWELASCNGWICSVPLDLKTPVLSLVCMYMPSCLGSQLSLLYSKHKHAKSKLVSQMASKNYVLNPVNTLPANGALNLPCRLVCLWLLRPQGEEQDLPCRDENRNLTWKEKKAAGMKIRKKLIN